MFDIPRHTQQDRVMVRLSWIIPTTLGICYRTFNSNESGLFGLGRGMSSTDCPSSYYYLCYL